MNVRRTMAIAVAAMCMGLATSAMAASPIYESWAKHQPGTTVQMKMTSEAAGQKTEMTQTYTLKSVAPEKCVVELASSMMAGGSKIDMPPQSMDVLAGDAPTAAAPTPAAPGGTANAKTSEETITIDGKEYKTTCTEATSDQNGMKMSSKTWTSPEVPGMNVKMEAKTEGTVASTTVSEVTAVNLK